MVREDRLRKFLDDNLIAAIKHPVRAHIFAVLNERVASTKEIGDELELDVTAFYKHVQILKQLDCIECVETRAVRGVKEHFFYAKSTMHLDDRSWRRCPATFRHDVTARLVRTIWSEAVAAVKAGKFGNGEAEHLSWTPARVDARGRREILKLLARTLQRLIAIQRASAKRLAKSGEPGFPITAAILCFEADRES